MSNMPPILAPLPLREGEKMASPIKPEAVTVLKGGPTSSEVSEEVEWCGVIFIVV
jgi:hypothetical protein